MSCFRTCRACREKDVTVSWRGVHGAALCSSCDIDAGRLAVEPVALAVPMVTFSPAAMRAMVSA
jgi:hypothetical protein